MNTAVATPDRITSALAEFRKSDEVISRIQNQYRGLTLAANGFETVTAARKELKQLRVGVEKLRKELKAESLQFGRAVDGEAARLTGLIEPVEAHLESQEAIHNEKKEAEKRARELEKQRITQARVDRLTAAGCEVDLASCQVLTDPQFATYFAALAERAAELKAEREAEERAAREAAEADRIEYERLAAERLAEFTEQLEANKRESDRLAAQRAQQEEQARVERENLEADRAKFYREQEVLREAESQRLAEIARQQNAAAELARAEALQPEIDKAENWTAKVEATALMELAKLDHPWWEIDALAMLNRAFSDLVDRVRGGHDGE